MTSTTTANTASRRATMRQARAADRADQRAGDEHGDGDAGRGGEQQALRPLEVERGAAAPRASCCSTQWRSQMRLTERIAIAAGREAGDDDERRR